MTPEEEAYKKLIEEAEQAVADAEDKLATLIQGCKHRFSQTERKYGGARCVVCERDFGWYCEKSPDHVCLYDSQDGKVRLIDDTLVPVPEGHDAKNESDDWCIFCGHPEERK